MEPVLKLVRFEVGIVYGAADGGCRQLIELWITISIGLQ
jgi:hypothetical protein